MEANLSWNISNVDLILIEFCMWIQFHLVILLWSNKESDKYVYEFQSHEQHRLRDYSLTSDYLWGNVFDILWQVCNNCHIYDTYYSRFNIVLTCNESPKYGH